MATLCFVRITVFFEFLDGVFLTSHEQFESRISLGFLSGDRVFFYQRFQRVVWIRVEVLRKNAPFPNVSARWL